VKTDHRWFGYDLDGIVDLKKKFDLVICSDVIEHVEDPEMLLENAARHLKEFGFLVVSSPDKMSLHEDNPLHINNYSTEELKAVLLANYFVIVDHRRYQETDSTCYTNNVFICKLKNKESKDGNSNKTKKQRSNSS